MNESPRTNDSAGGNWRMPKHKRGSDETWDALGDEWQAVDGVVDDTRIYVKWSKREDGSGDVVAHDLTGFCVVDGAITAELLRSIPVGRLARIPDAPPFDLDELTPLRRHDGEKPEDFATRVAWYYRVFASVTSKPAKEIAEHSGVPVGTVRGWIREARLRGKLPPGSQGRSG